MFFFGVWPDAGCGCSGLAVALHGTRQSSASPARATHSLASQILDDQQARTRAQNEALIAEQEQYYRDKARREQDLYREIREMQTEQQSEAQAKEAAFAANKQLYERSLAGLQAMLQGRVPYDLKQAVFTVENTFMNGQYRWGEFRSTIGNLAQLCRGLAGDGSKNQLDYSARFLALHQLMTDTVRVTYAGNLVSAHRPFTYDFVDFWGHEDHTKQFVTKLLQTNSGQCHSMPLLYKLVADELGITSYVSLAPNHGFIQVKDNAGRLYHYETTNGHFVTDAYYMSTGYIKAAALKNRAYLDTLTRQQTLACRVLDLAMGYEHRFGYDAFTEKCAQLALAYYPQSVQATMLMHNLALYRYAKAHQAAGSPPKEQAQRLPQLQPLRAAVEKWRRRLQELGHEEMPEGEYAAWLKSLTADQARAAAQQATKFKQTIRN